MCLIAFAFKCHPDYDLIVAANRDEFYARPTSPAHFWEDRPSILAGRDLQAGGTWMGVSKEGRFSAVTNYRDKSNIKDNARSRGDLPVNFLTGEFDTEEFTERILPIASEYNGFNLLCFDGENFSHFSNYENKVNILKPGIYGLSNALLDTPWPKLEKIKSTFSSKIENDFNHDSLLQILTDTECAPDDQLPDTGVGYSLEKMLSAIAIVSEDYGTCCNTVLTISKKDEVSFTERSLPVGIRSGRIVKEEFIHEKK